MTADPQVHALAIPWHRRLEARVLLGLTVIAGLSLLTVALVTSSVVRRHAFERARSDLSSARAAFATLITTRADEADREAALIAELPTFRAHLTDSDLASDRNTMEEMASRYCELLDASFCIVSASN